jgi:hypothetical protein
MGKVVLELEENPPVKPFHFYAYPLSMVLSRPEGYLWLYNNFIQVYCCPDLGPWEFKLKEISLTNHPALGHEYLPAACYDRFKINVLEYIKFGLEIKRFVYIRSDEFYNPERSSYQQHHFRHDLLIYGYADDIESFMVIGYDKTGHYKKSLFSYTDFLLSEPGDIHFFRLNEGYLQILRLDIPNIVIQVRQYLNLAEQTHAYGNSRVSVTFFDC